MSVRLRSWLVVTLFAVNFGAVACSSERNFHNREASAGEGPDAAGSGGKIGAAAGGAKSAGTGGKAGAPSGGGGSSGTGDGVSNGGDVGSGGTSNSGSGGTVLAQGGTGAGPMTSEAGAGGEAGDEVAGAGGEAIDTTGTCAVVCAPEAHCVTGMSPAVCQCPAGYTDKNGDGSACEDFDECANANGGCDLLTVCTNEPGTFSCGACPSGYTGDGASGCVDIDECMTNNGGCDVLATCSNTGGSRTCGSCPHGYSGSGDTHCIDIDECSTNNGGCDASTTCSNTPGSFTCGNCPAGYTGGGSTGCTDIDECDTNHGGCDALTTCTNTAGSFSCGACPAGYTGTGATGCSDIDECNTNHGGCDARATCTNTAGSFSCGACPAGYAGTGATGCIDINECNTNHGGCDALTTCSNTAGSFNCGACPSGYTGTGAAGCTDVNECNTSHGGCDANADCANSPGSHSCSCKPNYTGDGTTCACAVAPATPKTLAPYRGAYTGSYHAPSSRKTLRPTFVFTSSSSNCGAVTYEIQADNSCTPGSLDSCAFSSPEVSVKGLTSPTYTPTTDLPVSKTVPVGALYAWRVRACDPTSVCSAWSSVAYLHVGRVREDVNGDGYGDMIVMNSTTQLLVYNGAATPDFTTVSATPAVPSSSDRIGAFLGDVDGDGYGDIGVMQYYTATSGYAPAVVFGGASLAARSPLVLIKSAYGSSLNLNLHAAGDVNGDGFDDFLVDIKYISPQTEVQLFYGASQPANQAALHLACNFQGVYTQSSNGLGDLNRDGYADFGLVEQGSVSSVWTGRIAIFAGGTSPSAAPVADITRAAGQASLLYPAGDLNGDGYGDAVSVENNNGLVLYQGGSTFASSVWKTLSNASTTAGVGGFDINGDGYGDLHVMGGSASIYLGGSAGPSSATPFPTARGADQFGGVTFSDYDGDGLPDLGGSASGQPMWCASSGTATPTCLNVTNNGAQFAASSYSLLH